MTGTRADGPKGASSLRPSLGEEEARLMLEMVQNYCGLTYGLDSRYFLERRIGPRMEALGLGSYREYYHHLRYDPGGPRELEELVERLTTHETYFFREQYQLDAFRDQILPELQERLRPRQRLAIWSAGCSTGEEVYTVAMLLREAACFQDWNVRVAGSDLSRKVIAQARRGCYGWSSFRTTPEYFRCKYFEGTEGRYQIREELRSWCSFGQLNLLATERYGVLGPCDVILCRNVMMYLAPSARERIVEAFYQALAPGGYLLLGHSESLLHLTTRFHWVQLAHDLVYRRPER